MSHEQVPVLAVFPWAVLSQSAAGLLSARWKGGGLCTALEPFGLCYKPPGARVPAHVLMSVSGACHLERAHGQLGQQCSSRERFFLW